MPRLPLVSDDAADPAVDEVFARSRREGREPIALYRVLANRPEFLESYSALARTLRYSATTDRALRELVILRTAQLVRSDYEWAHHVWMATAAGVSSEQIEALDAWEASSLYDVRERAALRLAEQVHALGVTDESFTTLASLVGEAGAFEVVATAAVYQSVARMIQGFGIEVEPEYEQYLEGAPSRETST